MSNPGGVSVKATYHAQNVSPATSITVSVSPTPGDVMVAVLFGYNTAGTCFTYSSATPTGWSSPVDSTCSGRNTIWTLYRTAGSGETSYQFTVSGSEYLSAIVYDLSGAASAPVDVHADAAFTASGSSQTSASLTPTQNGDLAIASFANGYFKDPSFSGSWSTPVNADSGVYLSSASKVNAAQAAISASVSYGVNAPTSGESNLLLIQPSTTVAKFLTWGDIGATSLTSTQANNWYSFCELIASPTFSLQSVCNGSPAVPVEYYDVWKAEASNTGVDTSEPFHESNGNYNGGTCPQNSTGAFWAAGPASDGPISESWFLHAGGTSSTVGNRLVSFLGSSSSNYEDYIWYLNPSAVQTFVDDAVANCVHVEGSTTIGLSQFAYGFMDNTEWRPSNGYANFGAYGYNNYIDAGPNATGNPTPPPYASAYNGGSCPGSGLGSSFYNGSWCTSTTQISSSSSAVASTYEYSTDNSYQTAMTTLLASVKHQDGSQYQFFINGLRAADSAILSSAGVVGGVAEKAIVDNGSHGNVYEDSSIIDTCSYIANDYPAKDFVILDTSPGTGTYALGNANHQFDLREHYAAIWMCAYPNLVDQPYMDSAVTGANFIFPGSYFVPVSAAAYQTADAPGPAPCAENYRSYEGTGTMCTSGGAHQSQASGGYCAAGTAPNCVFVREFQHCSWNSSYTSIVADAVDEGPCAVAWNLETSGVTFSSSWFQHWSSYNHIISFCTNNGSYLSSGTYTTGTTAVCSGTSGNDVANGGTLGWTITKSSFTGAVPEYDAVFLTAK